MWRLVMGELRHRRARAVTLGTAILLASLGFVLLTASVSTSQLQIRGTIDRNSRGAYDLLVRPAGARTPLEDARGLVRPDYLSGTFGGISLQQLKMVRDVPGVEVAAPIAYLGYILPNTKATIPLGALLSQEGGDQLYRLRLSWAAHSGISRYQGSELYALVTNRADGCRDLYLKPPDPQSPFDWQGPRDSRFTCYAMAQGSEATDPRRVTVEVDATFPFLIAAIDPEQENELLRFDRTMVDGSPLTSELGYDVSNVGSIVPVVASTRTYLDEELQVRVERIGLPAGRSAHEVLLGTRGPQNPYPEPNTAYTEVRALPGRSVGELHFTDVQLYPQVLESLEKNPGGLIGFSNYWTTTRVQFNSDGPARLRAQPLADSLSQQFERWRESAGGFSAPPPQNQDVQYRRVIRHPVRLNALNAGVGQVRLHGTFNPELLPSFSRLSALPLESYYPPLAEPGDLATSRALGGRPLGPTQNIGGYLAQPPLMLTTLKGAGGLTDPRFFGGANHEAPISAIRVRVAGITGLDKQSQEAIRIVAQQIATETGLDVDVTVGSSPAPQLTSLPKGAFGQPALTLQEGWVRKGAAVAFLSAVDRKSLAVFLLVLVVCMCFLINATAAAVRTRRSEFGVLTCLGWSRGKILALIEIELLAVGCSAGLVGILLGLAVGSTLNVEIPVSRTLLIAPGAAILAAAAGAWPAMTAAFAATPLEAVRPSAAQPRRARRVLSIRTLASANVRRQPGRTLLGAVSLAVGVAAFAGLLAVLSHFQGVLVGSLLGDAISVQVRGVDLAAAVATMLLGAAAVADVSYLNIRDRADELAILRATGWADADLRKLLTLESTYVAVLGSLVGAVLGGATVSIASPISVGQLLLPTAAAAAVGIVAGAVATAIPVRRLNKLAPVGAAMME